MKKIILFFLYLLSIQQPAHLFTSSARWAAAELAADSEPEELELNLDENLSKNDNQNTLRSKKKRKTENPEEEQLQSSAPLSLDPPPDSEEVEAATEEKLELDNLGAEDEGFLEELDSFFEENSAVMALGGGAILIAGLLGRMLYKKKTKERRELDENAAKMEKLLDTSDIDSDQLKQKISEDYKLMKKGEITPDEFERTLESQLSQLQKDGIDKINGDIEKIEDKETKYNNMSSDKKTAEDDKLRQELYEAEDSENRQRRIEDLKRPQSGFLKEGGDKVALSDFQDDAADKPKDDAADEPEDDNEESVRRREEKKLFDAVENAGFQRPLSQEEIDELENLKTQKANGEDVDENKLTSLTERKKVRLPTKKEFETLKELQKKEKDYQEKGVAEGRSRLSVADIEAAREDLKKTPTDWEKEKKKLSGKLKDIEDVGNALNTQIQQAAGKKTKSLQRQKEIDEAGGGIIGRLKASGPAKLFNKLKSSKTDNKLLSTSENRKSSKKPGVGDDEEAEALKQFTFGMSEEGAQIKDLKELEKAAVQIPPPNDDGDDLSTPRKPPVLPEPPDLPDHDKKLIGLPGPGADATIKVTTLPSSLNPTTETIKSPKPPSLDKPPTKRLSIPGISVTPPSTDKPPTKRPPSPRPRPSSAPKMKGRS